MRGARKGKGREGKRDMAVVTRGAIESTDTCQVRARERRRHF